jgi:hypothetical protein
MQQMNTPQMDAVSMQGSDRETRMNTISTPPAPESALLATTSAAANADRMGDLAPRSAAYDTKSGWDSYEVWHRFIKEARDRRERTRS